MKGFWDVPQDLEAGGDVVVVEDRGGTTSVYNARLVDT